MLEGRDTEATEKSPLRRTVRLRVRARGRLWLLGLRQCLAGETKLC